MPALRHTEQRQAVLRTVKFAATPLSPAQVLRAVRRAGISRATLYRGLKHLVESGEIAALDGPDGTTLYVGHAFHQSTFRCQRCGKVRILTSQSLPAYVDRKMFGHQAIVTSQLVAQGLCGSCARKGARR